MSEERSKLRRRYADAEFAQSETDCVSVKRARVRMRKLKSHLKERFLPPVEMTDLRAIPGGGFASVPAAGSTGTRTWTPSCYSFRVVVQGQCGISAHRLKPVPLGGMSGIRGLAGVCAEAGKGRGIEAHPCGNRSGAGDYGGGATGHARQGRRTGRGQTGRRRQTGRNACPTQSGVAV